MKKVLFSVAAAALLGLGLAASPASAAPTGPVQVDPATTNIVQVRMTKRQMMMRKRMMRRSGMRNRRMMRGGDPNANMQSRPPMQRNSGQTTGGPRY